GNKLECLHLAQEQQQNDESLTYKIPVVQALILTDLVKRSDLVENGLPANTTAVVNLAGQNVLDPTRRWTPGFKQNVWASRVNTTQSLAQAIIRAQSKPKVFVSISGVGIYQPSDTAEYNEDNQGKSFDFLSQLCHEWEGVAKLPAHLGVRQIVIRSGVVLGRNGGMIKQLYLPFYFGLGGPVGRGDQFMPWIHIQDMANLLLFTIENEEVRGVLNGVAPQVITNKEFTKAFAKALWRPAMIPIPEFALNFAFSEERAKMMTAGQKVIPKRTLAYGFEYKYPDIESACREVVQ
ncbi:Epimerase family protein SDR39U1, partial [Blattella germanica]